MKTALKIIAIVVLLALLGGVCYFYKVKSDERRAALVELSASQKEYEKKLKAIDEEIEAYKASMTYARDTGDFVIAFECAGIGDAQYALRLGEAYGFFPEIVVNCNADAETLAVFLEELKQMPVDVMLTSSPFNMENVNRAKDLLLKNSEEYDYITGETTETAPLAKISGVFLLRGEDCSDENVKALAGNYVGYTTYTDSVEDGIDGDGMLYFAYECNESGALATDNPRFTESLEKKSVLLLCFKLGGVLEETARDHEIRSSLDIISVPEKEGKAHFVTVNNAVADINALSEKLKSDASALDTFLAEKDKEKAEIEESIKALQEN